MRLAVALLVLVALTGCTAVSYDLAGGAWKKPDVVNLPQTTLDEMDCVREAREAGWTPDLGLGGGIIDTSRWFIGDALRRHSYNRCMIARGYQPS